MPYDPRPEVTAALSMIEAGLAQLAAADLTEATDDELGEALLAVSKAQTLRLASGGFIHPEVLRHLTAMTNPTLRMVLGLAPWLPVSVGRAQRTMPGWLRAASQMAHPRCRARGCDLPFAICELDHTVRWADGGHTSLITNVPMCEGHNDLKEQDGWKVTFDTATGTVTWTSADGTRTFTLPPPDL